MASVMDGAALLTAMDTRFSGPEILNRVMDGLAGHCPVGRLGVLPTPGLSYLLGHGNWRYGMMITASHNPAEDNGIKLFNACGEKIPDELEAKISRIFREQSPGRSLAGSTHAASAPVLDADPRPYLDFLLDQASRIDLRGLSLLVDTANGAMCGVAPEVLARTGARLTPSATPMSASSSRCPARTWPSVMAPARRAATCSAIDADAGAPPPRITAFSTASVRGVRGRVSAERSGASGVRVRAMSCVPVAGAPAAHAGPRGGRYCRHDTRRGHA